MHQDDVKKLLFYHCPPDLSKIMPFNAGDGFELTADPRDVDEAVAVIFHMPALDRDDRLLKKGMKKKGQLWVFWSTESESRFAWQYESEVKGLFDLTATYRLDSDVPLPFLHTNYYGSLRKEPVRKIGFISAFISGDFHESKRLEYLKELMRYVDIHSYGEKLNTKSLKTDPGRVTKEQIMARYKFSIAFEDSVARDYVTENLFDPLIAGSVPVYFGAPNVDEFLPGNECCIKVRDYSCPRALADHLLALDKDEESYRKYLSWKTRPYKTEFYLKGDLVVKHPLMRLCNAIKARI